MNKIYLILILMVTFTWASAQNSNIMDASNKGKIPVTVAQQMGFKSDIKSLHSSTKATEGRWYNYAATLDNSLGGISALAMTYLFPDTQITAMYGTTASTPWVHSAGIVLDPKSAWFQSGTEFNIDNGTAYTIDSIGILCIYSRNNASTSIVDTLIVEFVAGTSAGLPTYYFTGMSANYFSDTLRFRALTFTNSMLDAGGTVVKVPLTAAVGDDTTATGWNYISVGPASPINVMAGEVVAVTYQFKPGYAYTQSTVLNDNNYFTFVSYEEQGDNTYPTYAPGDYNSSQIMASETKFDATSGWYGFYIPEFAYTQGYSFENHLVDFKLSINVGMDIIERNSLNVSQNRPNPFTGSTSINYNLVKAANVSVSVYNVAGAEVMTVAQGLKSAGSHQVQINAANLPAGVYYYTFTADNDRVTKKMIVY